MLKKLFGFMYAVAGLYWVMIETRGYKFIGRMRKWKLHERIAGIFGLALSLIIWPIGLVHWLIDKGVEWTEEKMEKKP